MMLFNVTKTLLICFRSCKSYRFLPVITLNNTVLQYKDEAIHLGHVLSFDLNDGPDITMRLKISIEKLIVLYVHFMLLIVLSSVFSLSYTVSPSMAAACGILVLFLYALFKSL